MRLFEKFFKKNSKQIAVVDNVLVIAMQQHIKQYPHSYFLRNASKNFTFKGR